MPRGRFSPDLAGQRFGKLLAIKKTGRIAANGSPYWLCECDCGSTSEVQAQCLTRDRKPTRSCKCVRKLRGSESPQYKHGKSVKGNPEYTAYWKEKYLFHKYKITPEQKQAMFDRQGGCCAICGYKFGQKQFDMHIDHCHTTGVVRGLLCNECNTGIGLLRENAEIMQSAIKYLYEAKYSLGR